MHKQDAQRVLQVLAGDSAAYEALVEAHKGWLFALVAGRIGNFSAAEDVVQNAFVEAYVNLKSLNSPDKFGGWLRGIAVNLANRWLQNRRPTVSIDAGRDDVTSGALLEVLAVDQAYETHEAKALVLKAVAALPEIYREAVLLHYMEGMTYGEIAALLDVPESTVTGRLQVARNRLRDELMPLVEETLQENRPTSNLTRKVMSALPPLLYAMTPSRAHAMMKLRGHALLKMMGFLGAGIVGTGLYFGGISAVMNWKGSGSGDQGKKAQEVVIELADKASLDDLLSNLAEDSSPSRKGRQGMASGNQVQETPLADFKVENIVRDSSVKIAFWIAKTYRPSGFVEIAFYDGRGKLIIEPIAGRFSSGDIHTVFMKKSEIPGDFYLVRLALDHSYKRTRIFQIPSRLPPSSLAGIADTATTQRAGLQITYFPHGIGFTFQVPDSIYPDSTIANLTVYNATGLAIMKLVNNEKLPAGKKYTMNLSREPLTEPFTDKVYYVRLLLDQGKLFQEVRKLVVN